MSELPFKKKGGEPFKKHTKNPQKNLLALEKTNRNWTKFVQSH